MNTYSDKKTNKKSEAVTQRIADTQQANHTALQFVDNRPEATIQRKILNIQTAQPIQLQKLPVARHREIVKDAAKLLDSPQTASDNTWIKAIYKELDGTGNPAANKCVDELIKQNIIDMNDWLLIEKDYKLYKSSGPEALELHERHNVPNIHGAEEAAKWVASLIKNRIEDLYSTLAGFPGHAIQVQQSITYLGDRYKEGKFDQDAYNGFYTKIVNALRTEKAKAPVHGIPEHTYKFYEKGNVTI
ncbi:hypothetical protein [Kordia sp.]|uniref:hypothetical protein n=1 Tax=Kordia sp. TaxID=1965332 RepID=UPI003B5AC4C8